MLTRKYIGRVLIACEESATCREEFARLGWDSWSCDLLPSRIPSEKHYRGDIFDIIEDGFDMMIAFPPCTRLTVTANKWYKPQYRHRFPNILQEREDAVEFFIKIANANIKRIAIENPVGIMSTRWRKPDQIAHPYYFGDEAQKRTCLWLKNLPPLLHNREEWVSPGEITTAKSGKKLPRWIGYADKKDRAKLRSKTFPGIAKAMAKQWTRFYLQEATNANP